MNTRIRILSVLVLAPALVGGGVALADPDAAARAPLRMQKSFLAPSLPVAEDFGPAATNEQGTLLLGQIEGKWSGVMRLMKGWDDSAFQQFRVGYRNYPVSVLEQALAAETFDSMLSAFNPYAAAKAQKAMAKAFPMGSIRPEDAANPQVVEAQQLAGKALGEDARDLVFIPVTPCTVWDTRYAASAPFMGIIGNGVTRQFYSHWNGAGGSYAPYGGNPSCPETAQDAIGGRPFAVMMTVYVNDAVGNGWLTFYRDGDADPSQATISVYYSTGPTRTQTVISKSSRGYGTGSYDLAVTGRFGSAHAAASVTGYFIKPQATALDCTTVTGTGIDVAAGSTRLWGGADAACAAGYTATGCNFFNTTATTNHVQVEQQFVGAGCGFDIANVGGTLVTVSPTARCCRVPGR